MRDPKRRLQILTNTFKSYNQEDPYIKKEHELIFSNEDINKLLQSDISKYELSRFVNDIRFFDIDYTNEKYSKQTRKHIKPYNGIDIYNRIVNTKKSSVSQNIKFSVINTANKDKKYLYRGGNKMTSIQLNELKNKLDIINKRENIRFLNETIQRNIKFSRF